MLLQETGVDFCQLPEELSFPAILGDQDVHVATANNVTEDRACYQAGGVASILYARLAGFLWDGAKTQLVLADGSGSSRHSGEMDNYCGCLSTSQAL